MNYAGLRKRQTYDELVGEIERDTTIIHYPDRRATQLRESPYLTQLDGEGMRQMENMEMNLMNEQTKQHILKDMAKTSGKSIAELTALQPAKTHNFQQTDIFQDDPPSDMEDATMTGEQDTQTDAAQHAEHYSQTTRQAQGTQGNQTERASQGTQGNQTEQTKVEHQDMQTDPMDVVAASSSSASHSKGVIKKAAIKQVVTKHLHVKDKDLPDVAMDMAVHHQNAFASQQLALEQQIHQSRQHEAEQLARIRLEEDNSKTRLTIRKTDA
jgi:hypothetical protein